MQQAAAVIYRSIASCCCLLLSEDVCDSAAENASEWLCRIVRAPATHKQPHPASPPPPFPRP
eukprot:COSAG06_NODE_28214_length_578_cov_1.382046_1_plen_61_part_10